MNVEFLEPAEAELFAAIEYYNGESEGLGYEFAAEIARTIERIAEFPDAWMPLTARTRRCRTNRFPYGVIYQVRGQTLLIVAVMHLNRSPHSWKDRVPPTER